jgi:hypothetical protein
MILMALAISSLRVIDRAPLGLLCEQCKEGVAPGASEACPAGITFSEALFIGDR